MIHHQKWVNIVNIKNAGENQQKWWMLPMMGMMG